MSTALAEIVLELIDINLLRSAIYTQANQEMIDNKDLKAIFRERSQQSTSFIADLEQEGIKKPEVTVSTTQSIPFKPQISVLEKCELGDELTVKTYEKALKYVADIPAELREKISLQLGEIKKSYEFIKNFKDFNLDLTA